MLIFSFFSFFCTSVLPSHCWRSGFCVRKYNYHILSSQSSHFSIFTSIKTRLSDLGRKEVCSHLCQSYIYMHFLLNAILCDFFFLQSYTKSIQLKRIHTIHMSRFVQKELLDLGPVYRVTAWLKTCPFFLAYCLLCKFSFLFFSSFHTHVFSHCVFLHTQTHISI